MQMSFVDSSADYIKVVSLHRLNIPKFNMEHRASILWIALLSLLGNSFTFQEKAPLQGSLVQQQEKPSQHQPPTGSSNGNTGSSRGIDEHIFKSISKTGYKYFMSPSSRTIVKPMDHHRNHYFYLDDYQYKHQEFPSGPGPRVTWSGYPQQPYNSWYGWGWGPGYPFFGYPYYPVNPGYLGVPNYPDVPSYPGYPLSIFRESTTDETEPNELVAQTDFLSRSSLPSYQARGSSSTHIDGKSNSEVFPPYQLLNVARV